MGAARWVVIGTALVAAAVAFHMLMSPTGGTRAVSVSNTSESKGTGPSGPPQDEIDAESRDAMRDLLRQTAQDEE